MANEKEKIVENLQAPEVFADGTLAIGIVNGMARMVFHSDRLDMSDGTTVCRCVTCRVAMPVGSFVDLYNQMAGIMAQLEKAGQIAPGSPGGKSH